MELSIWKERAFVQVQDVKVLRTLEALRASEMTVTSENPTPDSGGVSQAKCRCTKYNTQGHLQIMCKRDIRSINNHLV